MSAEAHLSNTASAPVSIIEKPPATATGAAPGSAPAVAVASAATGTISAAAPGAESPWILRRRPDTGLFVVSRQHGTLLFRVDLERGMIYPWDKKAGREVPIPLAALAAHLHS